MRYFNKEWIKYIGLLFLSMLLITKLPHNSFSAIQYIIPPIRFHNGMLQLAGLIPLIIYIIGIKGLLRQEYFERKNKVLSVMIIVFIITPIMMDVCNTLKVPYYKMMNDVRSIEFEKSTVHTGELTKEGLIVNVEIKGIDYSSRGKEISVVMHFPKSWQQFSGQNQYVFKETYLTEGHKQHFGISEQFVIPIKQGYSLEDIEEADWYYDTFKYELKDKEQTSIITVHGV